MIIGIRKSIYDEFICKSIDRSKLVRKQVTDKNGRVRTVWVRPDDIKKKSKPVAAKKEDPETEENKKNSDVNKLPDNFYSYSKETQENIKSAKYSIVKAKYTDRDGDVTYHNIAVVLQDNETNMFDNAGDVVKDSILYGAYGRDGKKEIESVRSVSPYEFEKITGQKVGEYANRAMERDYSYVSLKNDKVSAIQKEDEAD